MNEKYYTVQEVADRLRVSDQAVRRWIKEGKLKAVRIGREYRITEESLEKAIRESLERN